MIVSFIKLDARNHCFATLWKYGEHVAEPRKSDGRVVDPLLQLQSYPEEDLK